VKKLALLAMPLLMLPACGGDSASGPTTVVKGTDTTCEPAATTFTAGTHRFELANEGTKASELYVYGPGDKIVAEVEDVGPGTKRALKATLKAGTYELACKPGQTGAGIRVPITVT
jgi:iron uptake system component EfeO